MIRDADLRSFLIYSSGDEETPIPGRDPLHSLTKVAAAAAAFDSAPQTLFQAIPSAARDLVVPRLRQRCIG